MERLKITAISLLITIMTFEFGPLVLSALLYYAYTYCEDRPEKKNEFKAIPNLYIYTFIALPFIVFYILKYFGIQKEIFGIMKFIFNLKLVELYDFDYAIEDIKNIDNLIMFSIAHLFSIFSVFMFSVYIVEHWGEKCMGLPSHGSEKKMTPSQKVFRSIFLFFVLLMFVVIYYFSFKDAAVAENRFYRGSMINILFFPVYIFSNILYMAVLRAKPSSLSN